LYSVFDRQNLNKMVSQRKYIQE